MTREELYRRALGLPDDPFFYGYTIVHDSGGVKIGIVRDALVTPVNDFKVFGEVFEGYTVTFDK